MKLGNQFITEIRQGETLDAYVTVKREDLKRLVDSHDSLLARVEELTQIAQAAVYWQDTGQNTALGELVKKYRQR